ncbi:MULTISPECIES: nicotinate-nucleotide--dimethylbenzimidazole phosphoribosyltransferase [Streptomyces]|uniref:Nicotinate-nucleotide--dimethylbenzimidazole phosphoribosyltransferase n=2 Tax=Streptomyces TaxID=1883 RepID=A0ABW0D8K4_STRFI
MTDTGQVPGEGLPENAGMVEQPGVPAPDPYAYLSGSPAEDEDLLLPGAQGAWGNEVAPPAPEPVVETVHEPGPHEMSGRDSGSVDLGGVRLPDPGQGQTPAPGFAVPHEQSAPAAPRRPLHLGPPVPNVSAGPVRSLADRGPAHVPVRQSGPPTLGPEYLDVPRTQEAAAPQAAAPWGAQATAGAGAAPAETVAPPAEPVDAAQAVVARVATEAGAGRAQASPAEAGQDAEGAPLADAGHETAAAAAAAVDGDAGQGTADVPAAGTAASGQTAATGAAVAQDGEVPASAPGAEHEPAPVAEPAPETVTETGHAPASVVEPGPVSEPAPSPEAAAEPDQVPAPAAAPAAGTPGAEPAAHPTAPGATLPETAAAEPDVTEPAAEAPGAEPGPGTADEAPVARTAPDPARSEDTAPAPGATGEEAAARAAAEPGAETVTEAPAAQAAPVPQAPAAAGPDTPHAPAGAVGADPVTDPVGAPGPAAGAPAPTADAASPAPEAVAASAPRPEGAAPEIEPEAPAAGTAPAPEATVTPEAAEDTPRPADGLPVTAPSEHVPDAATEQSLQQADAEQPHRPAEAEPVAPPSQGLQQTPAAPAVPDGRPAQPGPQDAWAPVPAQPGPADPALPGADATAPVEPGADAPETSAAAHDAPGTATPLPGTVHLEPGPDQPLGQFVPVEGTVPTTPHLAPTPPRGLTVPTEEQPAPEAAATVPAPREAEADAVPAAPDAEPDADRVQNADDLDTRGAGVEDGQTQEEGTAAAAEAAQSAGPAAPGYDDAEREAVLKVMRERRDIRNGFRSDPIPHEVLLRVLEAAHTAPSVGHSQPWDFVVIRSAETRRSMHELAMRQRDAYAKSLPKGRAKQFKELKIEAILDTPVNIVVTADPTRGGRHTLGRHTQPQMAPYSSALAVENLWLAARAEGLGVGWVSFFDEREMVRALGLPEHLEVVAYLCVGYVDEFPDEPELMQAGWSKRRPLSWVVHEETYGRRALPGEEPHDLLAETVAQIRPLDAKALGEAWERQKRMTKPAGALGMLEIISAQLSGLSRQCPPPIPEPAAVAIFAGDHGVHAQGVTPWPQEVTAQMVANFLGGGAVCNAFATQVGAEVCVVDVGVCADLPATPGLLPRKVRAGTSDMTTGPAMTREEAKKAIEVGIETARDLVAAGNKALLTGEMGIANTTASAALISVYTGADPAEVTGRGTGINDETLARKTEVVRRALELHQPDPADPIGVLAAVGGFEHAAMVGLLLGGASLRTPVILDGVSAGAAALVARAIAPEVLAACIAGHRSAEPGHVAALNKLGLRPLVDLDLRLGEGTGALLALPLVQSTARAMHEVATFDSAGVTEK